LKTRNVAFIIVIRAEWVYQLRFLDTVVPQLHKIVDVKPLAADPADHTSQAIAARLSDVLDDRQAANQIFGDIVAGGGVLPLEVQIVGSVIESERNSGERIGLDWFESELGGARGAIDKFFSNLLSSSPNRRVALKVLCALSFRTQFRHREPLADLLEVLFEDEKTVKAVLRHLSEHNVVVEQNSSYQLAHDYLAIYFNRLTALELDPHDRENILYSMDNRVLGASTPSTVIKNRKEREANATSKYARILVFALLGMMVIRLLWAANWWVLNSRFGMVRSLLANELVDGNYLPIFVVHLVWAWYVMLYYERVLAFVKQGAFGQLFSKFVVANMCLCVLAAMFFPAVWILSIGWGGFIVGLQAFIIGKRKDLNLAAKRRLLEYAGTTVFNTIIIIAMGCLVIAGIASYDLFVTAPTWVYFGSSTMSFVLTFVGLLLGRWHVTAEGASRLLGLLSRQQTTLSLRAFPH
jgi:hypothetical protein